MCLDNFIFAKALKKANRAMPAKKNTFWKFLISKVFFKNLGIAIGITLLILVIIQVSLRIYTDHGKEIIVPELSGLSLEETDKLCFQEDLRWIIQDSLYLQDQPGGVVLDQYPSPGARVKKNRKIFLIVNSWNAEIVLMPKAYETPHRQAVRILEASGLHVDSIEYEPYFAETYVRKQKYKGEIILEGTPIEKGSGITLVLGQGLSDEKEFVPRLIHITQDSARDLIMDTHFSLGAIVYDETVVNGEDSAVAQIFRQLPDFRNNKARLGSAIDVWLTIDTLKLIYADSTVMPPDSLLIELDSTSIESTDE